MAGQNPDVRRLELLEALARTANEAASPEAAMHTCLERISAYAGWDCGRVAILKPDSSVPTVESSVWLARNRERYAEFVNLSERYDHAQPSGKFISVALRDMRPLWVEDFGALNPTSRLVTALKVGLRSGFVFPIIVQGNVAAFLEFFSEHVRRIDRHLLEAIGSVGAQLARLIERARAEAAREQLLGVLEASLNELYIFDPDTLRFLYINRSALRNLGYAADAIRDMTPLDIEADFTEDTFRDLIAPLRKGERELIVYQTKHRRADGSLYPVEVNLQRVGHAAPRVFLAVVFDISDRLKGERALRDQANQLRRLSRRLLETEEAERRRLARELHDRIGQNVTALNLNLNLIRAALPPDSRQGVESFLEDCDALVAATGQLIRDVMADLRPPGLDELGLAAALAEHARQVGARSGFTVTLTGVEKTPRLHPDTEIAMFRASQEALANVAKHARATHVNIVFELEPDFLTLSVADNGRGFDPVATPSSYATPHLGLPSMRERAESVGAQLRVESAIGRGTRVIVKAPREPVTHPGGPRAPGTGLS